ncbi:Probable periplasmic serine endoprotease DegP-like [Seminavis robusta]|uniref:Probable periplasmic serine endoprotease DegP-like n=1 Tax=Seminavis robusta TaxID=568900 RepID=A0A9N8E1H8_9STRA|nr:Probable periplasmic serine endoprotease DegP-like [Seminavis robusta]|eukprot:Sro556_g166020.1 Probable periplasmic serine endoprotease DegP-like (452) ;mRNA; f:49370-50945
MQIIPSLLASLLLWAAPSLGWVQLPPFQHTTSSAVSSFHTRLDAAARIAVPASELDADLTSDERTVVSVVRSCGPSVAFVTSVLPLESTSNSGRRRRRWTGTPKPNNRTETKTLPRGQSLGSGSAFVVDETGYLVTNYHVIESAYRMIAASKAVDAMVDGLVANATNCTGFSYDFWNSTVQSLLQPSSLPLPQIYVRLNSETRYQACRVVGVKPDLDVAVLQVLTEDTDTNNNNTAVVVAPAVHSVTTGVVSAVDRELNTVGGRSRTRITPIQGCIQTDAAINPGNSGGPLLSLKGQVVGVNTAIVSTSGSNAGIGFAVPSDQIQPVVEKIILNDKASSSSKKGRGWLGVSMVDRRTLDNSNNTLGEKNWVARVEPHSPAEKAGIRAIQILDNGSVRYGDAIVAIAGKTVETFVELQTELKKCVVGENLTVTLEDEQGERRVVYIDLEARP